jgi:mono/diheme cytochrome c family protein
VTVEHVRRRSFASLMAAPVLPAFRAGGRADGAATVTRGLVLFLAAFVPALFVAWPDDARSHELLTTTVLFDREIVRILDAHCVMCHAADGPSFPLESYEQTWLRRRNVRNEVIARHMPPWAASPGYGHFANDNSLTLRETQFVVSWVEGLGPRNAGTVFTNTVDPAARPEEVRARNLHAGHWHLGQPALVRALPPARIEARQPDHVRRTVVDLGLASARRVRAVEYLPGDRRVLRAAFFTSQETGQWIGSWTPWYGYMQWPDGTALTLPAGSHIVAELHFRGASEPVVDEGRIGLSFAEESSPRPVSDLVLTTTAAGAAAPGRRWRAERRIVADTYAAALRPELSAEVASLEVSARTPEGGTDVLLFARDFDATWPTPYIFKEPVLLRRGSIVTVTAYSRDAKSTSPVRLTISGYPAR